MPPYRSFISRLSIAQGNPKKTLERTVISLIDTALLLSMTMIFLARVTDVSLGTFRILQLVRGHKIAATMIGFFEIMIYMAVLSHILGGGRTLKTMELLAYCTGYAFGNYVGAFMEDKFMKGYTMLEAMAPCSDETLKVVDDLRDRGFGTTMIRGEGKNGPRYIIKIICNRKDIPEITRMIKHLAFVTVFDVKSCLGGYFRMKRK